MAFVLNQSNLVGIGLMQKCLLLIYFPHYSFNYVASYCIQYCKNMLTLLSITREMDPVLVYILNRHSRMIDKWQITLLIIKCNKIWLFLIYKIPNANINDRIHKVSIESNDLRSLLLILKLNASYLLITYESHFIGILIKWISFYIFTDLEDLLKTEDVRVNAV